MCKTSQSSPCAACLGGARSPKEALGAFMTVMIFLVTFPKMVPALPAVGLPGAALVCLLQAPTHFLAIPVY